MKRGGGKQKGAAFERKVCQQLSLWVSDSTHKDLFWRSAMSGGRATVGHKKGISLSRQAGDITAVAPEGHVLTDTFFVECKFLKNLRLELFFIHAEGPLASFWRTVRRESEKHNRFPLLIAKQNQVDTLLIFEPDTLQVGDLPMIYCSELECAVVRFDAVLKRKHKRVQTKKGHRRDGQSFRDVLERALG